jgi:4-amino-4-deoxy-L-arabinose transferase-like glycosyltransferase
VLGLFCVPLFIGLDRWDLHNDEAIYSYAVDRMVETGDWLTPRSIPFDNPFLEKPPLKFWLVAGAIRAGLLPKNEFGLRFFDALFGSIVFLYVYALARRLASGFTPIAGALSGVVSVLTLFTIDPLLFDHGLRSNNMEAALLLAYCGGIYHFARWIEAPRRVHALAVSLFFVLAFMTKFVAALFFPVVCVVALAWRRDSWTLLRATWRDWIVPAAIAVALIAPWFVYETWRRGPMLWQVMFGEHVFTRFTGALDATHLNPWHFYFSQTWIQLSNSGSAWIVLAGVALLAVKAWQGRPWLARLLFVWWLLPFVLISIGTSKLFHYAYPFLPPLALGAGAVAATIYQAIDAQAARLPIWFAANRSIAVRFLRGALYVTAVLAFIVSAWGLTRGKVHWEIDGTTLLSSSSALRTALAGVALLLLAGRPRDAVRGGTILGLLLVASWSVYWPRADRVTTEDHPLRALRDCIVHIQSTGDVARNGAAGNIAAGNDATSSDATGSGATGKGVYNGAATLAFHSYNYYFGRIGPWPLHEHPDRDELLRRLFVSGRQTPVILSADDYSRALTMEVAPGRSVGTSVDAVSADQNLVILTPGPYARCADAAMAAGASAVNVIDAGGRRGE